MALKSQSAMEYLLTYGWAVLAIAIVIIALFQLGVFNSANLTPHSTAGACQAVHTAAGSSLAGQCNSAQPKFVAQFNGAGYINVPQKLVISNQFTSAFWFYNFGGGLWSTLIAEESWNAGEGWLINMESPWYITYTSPAAGSSLVTGNTNLNLWYQVVVTNNNGATNVYINGVNVIAGITSISNAPVDFYIGARHNNDGTGATDLWHGLISNVQIYNTSLSSSEIASLYQEGIGGVPIDPSHIVGWWPLNGNAQDYSGDNNNGQAINVGYNSTWSSGYVQP